MKDMTIKLNASEASGEAYWRKRCDVVEAELSRLRAELATKEEALKGAEREISYMKGQRKVLKDKINDIAGDAAKNLVDATAKDDENKRLRAANAELTRILNGYKIALEYMYLAANNRTGLTIQDEQLYRHTCEQINVALSRGKQGKPETCVWIERADGYYNASCGITWPTFSGPEKLVCPGCGKRVEVKSESGS